MTAAIYNEIDPFAAGWLEELERRRHIAPGKIYQRSIAALQPGDVAGSGQRHFFAGVGGWSYAFRLAGIPDTADIWTGSCPCQPFSSAGSRLGADDDRHLWPEWFRLIRECRPPIIFGEQVASRDGLAWLDAVFADLEGAGYACGASDLCAAGVGAPHRRQRLYFVAYAGERGCGIERTAWLHDHWQLGNDATWRRARQDPRDAVRLVRWHRWREVPVEGRRHRSAPRHARESCRPRHRRKPRASESPLSPRIPT